MNWRRDDAVLGIIVDRCHAGQGFAAEGLEGILELAFGTLHMHRIHAVCDDCGSPFSGKILCGDCGSVYGSKVWHSNDKYRRVIWQCNSKFKNETKCTTPHVDEKIWFYNKCWGQAVSLAPTFIIEPIYYRT